MGIYIFQSEQIDRPWCWGPETRGEHLFEVTDEDSLNRALDMVCETDTERALRERQWRAALRLGRK